MGLKLTKEQETDAQRQADGECIPNYSLAGTGKTLTTLEAVKRARIQKGLITGPLIALEMWKREVENWLGAKAQIIRRSGQRWDYSADFHIMSYDLASKAWAVNIFDTYQDLKDTALVVDEAHALRGPTSKRTKGYMGPRIDGHGGIVSVFDQVWCLTGTPIYSHNNDVWSQLSPLFPAEFEDDGVLSYEQFLHKYTVRRMVQHHPKMKPQLKVVGSTNTAELHDLIFKDIRAIYRDTIDGLDTVFTDYEVVVKADGDAKDILRDFAKKSPEQVIQMLKHDTGTIAEVRRILGLAKISPSFELIADMMVNEPVLVGVKHTDVGQVLHDMLTKAGYEGRRVHGQTSAAADVETQELFNAGELDYIVGQIDAMGVSWNLQKECCKVVILEEDPSGAAIEQFYKRVARRGQRRTTNVIRIKATHSVDEALRRVADGKDQNVELLRSLLRR